MLLLLVFLLQLELEFTMMGEGLNIGTHSLCGRVLVWKKEWIVCEGATN